MMKKSSKQRIIIDDNQYKLEVIRKVKKHHTSPRLITVCYNVTEITKGITRACIESIKKFTKESHELWIVDNNSPTENDQWLRSISDINIILNKTTPLKQMKKSFMQRIGIKKEESLHQMKSGSYANAVGLELAVRFIDPSTEHVFVMHNDVLVCREGWLSFIISKLSDKVKGVAMSSDPARVNAMHVSGYLLDFRLFHDLQMNFFPNLPKYDVGDLVTLKLKENGYGCHFCKNTFNNPETLGAIAPDDPAKRMNCDRVFDDNDNLIYMHLGRGTSKSAGKYGKENKTYPEEWIRYADEYLLSKP